MRRRCSTSWSPRTRCRPMPARAWAGCRTTRRSPRGTTPSRRAPDRPTPRRRHAARLNRARKIVAAHARLQPDKIGARDSRRALTFAQWNERATASPTRCSALASQGRPRRAPRLQLRRVDGDLRRARQGRARRGADQLPPGRAGDRVHRRALRSARVHRAGRAASTASSRFASELAIVPDGWIHFGGDATPPGWQRLRGADRGRVEQRAGGRSRAHRHVGADVHVGDHRQAQGRDPQPRRAAR